MEFLVAAHPLQCRCMYQLSPSSWTTLFFFIVFLLKIKHLHELEQLEAQDQECVGRKPKTSFERDEIRKYIYSRIRQCSTCSFLPEFEAE